jgi:hypothetical protein
VKGAPRRGNSIGNWLTRKQAQELLSLPEHESLKGKRDYAILALHLGCGLRRKELVSEVKVGAMAQRENSWVLVDSPGLSVNRNEALDCTNPEPDPAALIVTGNGPVEVAVTGNVTAEPTVSFQGRRLWWCSGPATLRLSPTTGSS